ncbi:hypothetical protein D3C81_947060 [compost metagenome]
MQAVQDQTATRCQHVTQQRHLWAAQTIEHHVHAAIVGDLVDPHQQIFFLGDNHFLGTQRQQVLTFVRRLGRGNHPYTQRLAQLHKRGAGAVAGVSNQGKLPGFDPCQIGVAEISDQQRRVMHAGLNRVEHIRVTGQRRARQHNQLAINRIVVRALSRETGDLVTYRQVIDTFAHRSDDTGHFLTKAGWQLSTGRRQVLTPERVIPADANGFDAHLHFTRCRQSGRMLFAFEHLGWTKLVKTDRAGHRKPRQMNL